MKMTRYGFSAIVVAAVLLIAAQPPAYGNLVTTEILDTSALIGNPGGPFSIAMFMPVSEIVHAPGVELAGVIAEEIQLNQIFAAGVVEGSKEIEAAKQLIAFLASERASAAIKSSGMEPLRN